MAEPFGWSHGALLWDPRSQGEISPNGFTLPRATQPPLAAWKRQHQDFRLRVLGSVDISSK
ncbi:MAG: hypothetical protein, partial [Olavius algarvensis Gamma 1 endosymbiont]